jgi:hypothetical protein
LARVKILHGKMEKVKWRTEQCFVKEAEELVEIVRKRENDKIRSKVELIKLAVELLKEKTRS